MIYHTSIETPIGRLFIAKSERGVCRIGLPTETLESLVDWLQREFPGEGIREDDDILSNEVSELKEYFAGKRKTFTFPLDLRITRFRRMALEKVREIPYGETASYKEIAERVRKPFAVRAVGGANANNPIPIVIPCHRVIAHNGSLGGYGGGLGTKEWLLRLEGAL